MRFLPIFDLMHHNNGKMHTRSDATVDHGNAVLSYHQKSGNLFLKPGEEGRIPV